MAAGQSSKRSNNFKDLTGQTFGRLAVLKFAGINHRGDGSWVCHCVCGREKIVVSTSLISGSTQSCGCLRADSYKSGGLVHGHARHHGQQQRSPEYHSWSSMKQRCVNEKYRGYKNYGGRGVTVCERWIHSFENFLADMGLKPSTHHSLDRFPNTNGDYEPGNCRWATRTEQNNNTRKNRLIEYNGKSMTIAQWSRETGVPVNNIRQRLRLKWSVTDVFETPIAKRSHNKSLPK